MSLDYQQTGQDAPSGATSTLRTVLTRPIALLLILVMALGSVLMWIGVPLAWIWGVSQIVGTTQPRLGPYLLLIIGIPVSMWIVGRLLFRLNHLYSRVTGQSAEVRTRLPWLESLRGERDARRKPTVLDIVMIVSVSIALVAFAIWFFGFAGSSLPNA